MSTLQIQLTPSELVAPCGINCRLCRAYARAKNPCPGCRGDDTWKAKTCVTCKMKTCTKLAAGGFAYCFECDEFPCERLAHLDKRYRTKYAASPIDNLLRIKESGIPDFVESENKEWACPQCGAMLCMHDPQCKACGHVWR